MNSKLRHATLPTLFLLLMSLASTRLAAQDAQRVSIMSWNVTNFIEIPGLSIYPDRQAPRLPSDLALAKKYVFMAGADVIALQEIAQPAAASYLVGADYLTVMEPRFFDNSRRSLPYDIFVALALRKSRISSGPVREISELAMPFQEDDKSITYPRAGLYAEVSVGKAKFLIANIHLKAGCPLTKTFTRPTCLHLRAQSEKLGSWIESQLANGIKSIVVVGDFNREFRQLGDQDPVYQEVIRPATARGIDFLMLSHQPGACATRKNIYDYFFFFGDIVSAVDTSSARTKSPTSRELEHGAKLGDHCPTTVDLIFK